MNKKFPPDPWISLEPGSQVLLFFMPAIMGIFSWNYIKELIKKWTKLLWKCENKSDFFNNVTDTKHWGLNGNTFFILVMKFQLNNCNCNERNTITISKRKRTLLITLLFKKAINNLNLFHHKKNCLFFCICLFWVFSLLFLITYFVRTSRNLKLLWQWFKITRPMVLFTLFVNLNASK